MVTGIGRYALGMPSLISDGVEVMRVASTGISIATGTSTNLALKFLGDENTGVYSPGPDKLSVVLGGVEAMKIEPLLSGFYTSGGFQAYLSQVYEMFFVGADLVCGGYANGAPMIKIRSGITASSTRPAFTWMGDYATGLCHTAQGQTNIVASGVEVMRFTDSGILIATGTSTNLALKFFGDENSGFYSPSADQTVLQLGGVPYGYWTVGRLAMGYSVKTTSDNCAFYGNYAGGGAECVSIGNSAGRSMTGTFNVAVGSIAGENGNGTAKALSYSTAIGAYTGNSASQASNLVNATMLGYNTYTTASNQVVIGNADINDIQLGQGGKLARFTSAGNFVAPTTMITPEGGHCILATAGETLLKGELVQLSTTVADEITKTTTTSDSPIGVVYARQDMATTTVAVGSAAWVIISGKADVLVDAAGAADPGRVLTVSTATAGRVEYSATTPTTTHWKEVGHNMTTGAGGALIRAIVHFN